jgi:hypothetical protein
VRKILKLLLFIIGITFIAYGIYFAFGRPAIPLPSYQYTIPEGNQLYDLVKATKADEVRVRVVSSGEIEAHTGDTSLANIAYTPKSLNNALSIASKYVIPARTQNILSTISKYFPPVRIIPRLIGNFFYHIVRFRINIVLALN